MIYKQCELYAPLHLPRHTGRFSPLITTIIIILIRSWWKWEIDTKVAAELSWGKRVKFDPTYTATFSRNEQRSVSLYRKVYTGIFRTHSAFISCWMVCILHTRGGITNRIHEKLNHRLNVVSVSVERQTVVDAEMRWFADADLGIIVRSLYTTGKSDSDE